MKFNEIFVYLFLRAYHLRDTEELTYQKNLHHIY